MQLFSLLTLHPWLSHLREVYPGGFISLCCKNNNHKKKKSNPVVLDSSLQHSYSKHWPMLLFVNTARIETSVKFQAHCTAQWQSVHLKQWTAAHCFSSSTSCPKHHIKTNGRINNAYSIIRQYLQWPRTLTEQSSRPQPSSLIPTHSPTPIHFRQANV